jgi:hypothetical protein
MKNNEIIKFAAIFLLIGFALYRKYGKKNTGSDKGTGGDSGSRKHEFPGDDDYEPYSGK